MSEICHRFSTAVAFDLPSFQNGATYRKSKTILERRRSVCWNLEQFGPLVSKILHGLIWGSWKQAWKIWLITNNSAAHCQMVLQRRPRNSLNPLPVKSKMADGAQMVAGCPILLKFGRLGYYGWASW